MIKKMRLINFRIEDQLLDEIEKIAIEKCDENTSAGLATKPESRSRHHPSVLFLGRGQ